MRKLKIINIFICLFFLNSQQQMNGPYLFITNGVSMLAQLFNIHYFDLTVANKAVCGYKGWQAIVIFNSYCLQSYLS